MSAPLTIAEAIAQAEDALHALLIGRQAVEFRDQSGERVTYQPADADQLRSYIRELRSRLPGAGRCPPRTYLVTSNKGL